MDSLSAPWLTLPSLQLLFHLLEKEGATLRLVGGAVRDGLLGLPVNDIDLAINQPPEWSMAVLQKNHITVIPTGIDHGTITAIIDKRPFQITTLRVDVKTFGRKAHIAFTDDWIQDALRRDFTINAIYANKTGQLFDPVGGLEDLKVHRVRFIGNAASRIQEDYLRILRFFRFSARFGQEPYDAEGLSACAHYASYLPYLARERVTEEFLKILELTDPLYTLDAMQKTGVMTYILHPHTWDDLRTLVALEKAIGITPKALLRLAIFHPALEEIKTNFRLSKNQEAVLAFFLKDHAPLTLNSFKANAYQWGKEKSFDLALLQTTHSVAASQISAEEGIHFLQKLHHLFEDWSVPPFPLTGEDILSHGIKEGQRVGVLLRKVEAWWLAQDLKPDRQACLAYLATLL